MLVDRETTKLAVVADFLATAPSFEECLVDLAIRIGLYDEIEWAVQSLDEEFARCLSLWCRLDHPSTPDVP